MKTTVRYYCAMCYRRTSEDKDTGYVQCGCQITTAESLSYGIRPNGWVLNSIFTSWRWPEDDEAKNDTTKCPHCGKDLAWQGIGEVHEPVWKDGHTTCVWCNKEV